jgi:type I restriction enzyme S subunit
MTPAPKTIPKGWQLKQIKDLLDYERPDKYIVESDKYGKSGTPVLTANKSFILGYTDEKSGIYNDLPVIVFDDFTTDSKIVNFPFKVKSSAIKILKNKEGSDLRFIFETMKSIKFPTGAHKRYYISQYQDMEILVPPFPEQKKIAEILGAVDVEIQKSDEIIAATEKLKKGLMRQLFTRGIGHTNFKETKIGQIPGDWEVGGFKNLVNPLDKNAIKPGPFGSALKKSFYVNDGYKIYGQEQVISGDATYGNYYISEEKYKSLEGFKVDAGDILISLVGTIGKILIVPADFEKGIINPRLLKITPDKNRADSEFIAHLLNSDFLIQQMNQKSHGGTMNILNKGMLMSVCFGIPTLDEQKKIAAILSEVDKKISISQQLKAKLILLKKALMQDLLSGKVRVSNHLPGAGKMVGLGTESEGSNRFPDVTKTIEK